MSAEPQIQNEAVIQNVRNFILQSILIGAYDENLETDDSFLQKGILDSTGVLELVQFLEEQYGFKCHDREITPENLDSLKAIAAYVQRKLAQSSGTI